MRPWIPSFAALLTIAVLLASSSPARAGCNVIPQAEKDFHGYLGFADRPFAGPGQFITLGLSPLQCTATGHAFPTCGGTAPDVNELIATFFYKPRYSNTKHAAVIAMDCSTIDLSQGCGPAIPTDKAICVPANPPGVPNGLRYDAQKGLLSVRLPNGFCKGGNREYLPCETNTECGGGTCEELNPESPLTGPLTIAVTCAKDGPPCKLANKTCKQVVGSPFSFSASPKPAFCLDEIYSIASGTCNVGERHESFPSFTALPPENDFRVVCTDDKGLEPECKGSISSRLSFALDLRGDVLIPLYWEKVLKPPVGTRARLVSASTAFPSEKNATTRIQVPREHFTESYTRRGARLPALFEPQVSPERPNELTLFGTVDAKHSVVRVARRGRERGRFMKCSGGTQSGKPCKDDTQCKGGGICVEAKCQGGGNSGGSCNKDEDCPAGECGPSLFSFAGQANPDFGPVRITRAPKQGKICDNAPPVSTGMPGPGDGQKCAPGNSCPQGGECCDYRASAEEHIPLGPIESSQDLHAFVIEEGIIQRDLNGDGDKKDNVLTVRDRESGAVLRIGVGLGCVPPSGCPPNPSCQQADGRAVVMLNREGPAGQFFPFPALSLEGEVIAFVEDCNSQSEQGGPQCLGNLLRVYRRLDCSAGPMLQEITTGSPIIPELDQVIDDWALQVSGGKVFFRDGCEVLQVLDAGGPPGIAPSPLAPATQVATANGMAVLLRAETPACSAYLPTDLNLDGDTEDEVVQLWNGGGPPVNLGCAASDLDMSTEWVGALVSEEHQNTGRCPGARDLNGDGDCVDDVAHVIAVPQPTELKCADAAWRNLQQAGKKIGVARSAVAYLRPESDEGTPDLNHDGDELDDIMQVHFAASNKFADLNVAAEERYVLGDLDEKVKCQILAFHTDEAKQNANLNGRGGEDTDKEDQVLQLYELVGGETLVSPTTITYWQNTQQAVTECNSMACDPREPYKVKQRWIRFLTDEAKQGGSDPPSNGTDLDGDGAADDVVMQLLNACEQELFPATFGPAGIPLLPRTAPVFTVARAETRRPEERVKSFAMAGRCVENTRRFCQPDPVKDTESCPSGSWCEKSERRRPWTPLRPFTLDPRNTCHRDQGICFSSEDCPAGIECRLDDTKVFFVESTRAP